jgi:hypothetical protein
VRREIAAAGCEKREHDECEVATPHEAIAARRLEVRVELRGGDYCPAVAIREQVENEQRTSVERGDVRRGHSRA